MLLLLDILLKPLQLFRHWLMLGSAHTQFPEGQANSLAHHPAPRQQCTVQYSTIQYARYKAVQISKRLRSNRGSFLMCSLWFDNFARFMQLDFVCTMYCSFLQKAPSCTVQW